MDRRKFVISTSLSASSLIVKRSMESSWLKGSDSVHFHATNWGYNGNLKQFLDAATTAGYGGIEIWLMQEDQRHDYKEVLETSGLRPALLVGAWSSDFKTHLSDYKKNLLAATKLNPLFINCHAGKDYFTFEENCEIAEFAIETSTRTGIPIFQETHRGRMFFAAHITQRFLEAIPEIRLTLDISHWCNVHESLLQDQTEAVGLALQHSDHIHARVGHAEGPQVSDPLAPEWKEALDAHLHWWDEIVRRRQTAGQPVTITPEFGPPDYMPTVPYTGQPLADNWKVNVSTMHLLRQRYL